MHNIGSMQEQIAVSHVSSNSQSYLLGHFVLAHVQNFVKILRTLLNHNCQVWCFRTNAHESHKIRVSQQRKHPCFVLHFSQQLVSYYWVKNLLHGHGSASELSFQNNRKPPLTNLVPYLQLIEIYFLNPYCHSSHYLEDYQTSRYLLRIGLGWTLRSRVSVLRLHLLVVYSAAVHFSVVRLGREPFCPYSKQWLGVLNYLHLHTAPLKSGCIQAGPPVGGHYRLDSSPPFT
jgi:hypothetical protein